MKNLFFSCLAAAMLATGCTRSTVHDVSEDFNRLPAAVQETVRTKAPHAEVAAVRERTRAGHTVYVIEFRDRNRNPAMELAADGRLVKYEAGIDALGAAETPQGADRGRGTGGNPLSALPVNVQKAIADQAPVADVMEIRRREDNGRIVYEVEYAGREPRPVLIVNTDGNILKSPENRSRD